LFQIDRFKNLRSWDRIEAGEREKLSDERIEALRLTVDAV